MARGHSRHPVCHNPGGPVDTTSWSATVPAVELLLYESLELPPRLTVLVGENGSGLRAQPAGRVSSGAAVQDEGQRPGLGPRITGSCPPRARAGGRSGTVTVTGGQTDRSAYLGRST
jgi:hypothetical protein